MSEESLVPTKPPDPLQMVAAAIEKGYDPEKLKALLDFTTELRKQKAAEEFAEAMTNFQAECPAVVKSRRAQNQKMQFAFASFDDVMKTARPYLARYGLVVSFTSIPIKPVGDKETTAEITMTCRVRKGIHFEETTVTVPIPAGVVNNTQLMGQALTYAKRYAMQAALNIVVTDEDDDAAGLVDRISENQIEEVQTLLERKGLKIEPVLKWLQITTLEDCCQRDVGKLLDYLRRKPEAKN